MMETNKKCQFVLTLRDRKGNELNIGDIVKICDHKGNFNFYSEVAYLENEKKIAPFHTFSFHSFEKVDSVPEHAVLSGESRYKIWYTHNPLSENEDIHKEFDEFLTDWRSCEYLVDKSCFIITPI